MTKRALVRGQSLAVLLLAIALASSVVALADGFTFTTIDFPGAPQTVLNNINAPGQIVGFYGPGTVNIGVPAHGFLLDKGTFSTIDFPGANYTVPSASNPRGEIVGFYLDSGGLYHGFVLNRGTYTSVDAPFPGAAGTTLLGPFNPQGQIVGLYTAPSGLLGGFLLEGGVFTLLPQFPGSISTTPNGINASGDITGIWMPDRNTLHSFLLVRGSFTRLEDPEAGNCTGAVYCTTTFVTAINDHDQIVGWFVKDDGTTHGFLLSQGVYTTIDFPGAAVTYADGINDAGQIVGAYLDSSGVNHGFLATPAH
jgi:probable HAF family extracellular repeat protein